MTKEKVTLGYEITNLVDNFHKQTNLSYLEKLYAIKFVLRDVISNNESLLEEELQRIRHIYQNDIYD